MFICAWWVFVGVNEVQYDLIEVFRVGTPGQRAPGTTTGTVQEVRLWHRNHFILMGRASKDRNTSSPPRLALNTTLACVGIYRVHTTSARVALPQLQSLRQLTPKQRFWDHSVIHRAHSTLAKVTLPQLWALGNTTMSHRVICHLAMDSHIPQ